LIANDSSGEAPLFDVLVAGAGVVGTACARALQRSGYNVCVVDPEPPGSGCSYGNAGVIANDHVLPLSRPDVLRRVPGMLLRRDAPLALKISRVPALLPWMWHFAAACRRDRARRGSRATAALTGAALPAWNDELKASGGLALLRRHGMYSIYRSEAAFVHDAEERNCQRELGVDWRLLDGDALRQREPALSTEITRAVFYPDVAHVVNPQRLVRCLVDAFVRGGGKVLTSDATALVCEPHQVTVRLGAGRVRARYVVIAAGLGSRALCRTLGVNVPLAAEMGYHLTFPGVEQQLAAPVAAAEEGFLVTPMEGHLRAAGTVELAAREMPPSWRRADVLGRQAAALFRQPLPEPAERWRGSRPTLPDFLPAIGPLPGHPRVIAAFGHQHIGLTTAAITGVLVRDLVRGVQSTLDIAPYDPGRFSSFGTLRSRIS
jgi:glycine/D-amino acid oxidase-like deaminating enzyme